MGPESSSILVIELWTEEREVCPHDSDYPTRAVVESPAAVAEDEPPKLVVFCVEENVSTGRHHESFLNSSLDLVE